MDPTDVSVVKVEREGRARVSQADVLSVHQAMFSSPKMLFIRRGCSRLEQSLLRALVAEFHKSGVEETTLRSAALRMREVLLTEGQELVSQHGLVALAARLSSQRLILAEDFRQKKIYYSLKAVLKPMRHNSFVY
jgi:origin recognition complex subunit 1